MTLQLNQNDAGHRDIICAAAHRNSDVQAASSKAQHPQAAGCRRVAVGADQGFSGNAEPLQVYLMTDPITGPGKPDSVLFCHRLQVAVIVRIFKTGLQRIMVHIGD